MDCQNVINRIVAKKLAAGAAKAGCVPCFGAAARVLCINAAEKPAASGKR